MSEPFLSEIRIVGFTFPPRGWAQCDGQILPINQNQSLYSLLGTTFGGDGRTSFALPDLRGRSPMHFGQGGGLSNRLLGQRGGAETVAIGVGELAPHSHPVSGYEGDGTTQDPSGASYAASAAGIASYAASGAATMDPTAPAGGGGAHNNLPPYLVVNFIIALQGLFPSRN